MMKFIVPSKLCLQQKPMPPNQVSSFINRVHQILSIRKLLGLTIRDILGEVTLRCKLQYEYLSVYPENRPFIILKSLYKDTVKNIDAFEGLYQPEQRIMLDRLIKSQIESLDTRHGMVTETIADAFVALKINKSGLKSHDMRQSEQAENLLLLFLHRQASISALLQQGVGLTSSQHYCATGCVVESDIMALCIGVKYQAETLANHQFNWSPEIVILDMQRKIKGNDKSDICRIFCIPSFVRFALLEILKNALHATAELYIAEHPYISEISSLPYFDVSDGDFEIPRVHIDIISSEDSIEICVTDKGTGMTPEVLRNASRFLWASTINPSSMVEAQTSYQPMSEPLRGLGVGICLSTVYATHFGGSLRFHSDGRNKGTTVTLTIPRNLDILEKI